MFPYLHFLYFQLGPVKIYTWGFFVSLGFLIAAAALIKKYPREKDIFIDLLLYILIGAILGARLFFIILYAPDIAAAFRDFYKIWQGGMSSFGGFSGGALAIYFYVRVKKISLLGLLDKISFVLPLGLAVGRAGCYLINDHPGIKTAFWPLAVAYPDGARYDLGLLLFIFDALIFGFFLIKKKKSGYLQSFLIIYGIGRFFLDFLRIGEPKIAGLIPSQYGSIIMIVAGLYLAIKKIYRPFAK